MEREGGAHADVDWTCGAWEVATCSAVWRAPASGEAVSLDDTARPHKGGEGVGEFSPGPGTSIPPSSAEEKSPMRLSVLLDSCGGAITARRNTSKTAGLADRPTTIH